MQAESINVMYSSLAKQNSKKIFKKNDITSDDMTSDDMTGKMGSLIQRLIECSCFLSLWISDIFRLNLRR